MKKSILPNHAIRIWVVIGLLAYVALPWYAQQDSTWYEALPKVLGGSDTASGLVQAMVHGRKWLLVGLVGLVMASMAIGQPPGRQQANWLLAGGLVGSLGLAACSLLIGINGWKFEVLNTRFGALAGHQGAFGAGAFVAFMALVLLAAFGLARHGYFKGNLLVAGGVFGSGALVLLFVLSFVQVS